jgi:hypothetical protein
MPFSFGDYEFKYMVELVNLRDVRTDHDSGAAALAAVKAAAADARRTQRWRMRCCCCWGPVDAGEAGRTGTVAKRRPHLRRRRGQP